MLALAAAVLLGGATPVAGQSSASAAIPITVDVASGLTLTVSRNMDFGVVAVNQGPVTLTATSPGAAEVHLLAERSKNVQVTLTPPTSLTNGTGGTIPYTWAAAFNNSANDPATATAFATTTATVKPQENMGGNRRRAYIWLFGTLDVGNVPTGNYTGTFTVSATY